MACHLVSMYVLNTSKAVWEIQFVCRLGMAGQAFVNSMSRKIYVSLKRNVIACTHHEFN